MAEDLGENLSDKKARQLRLHLLSLDAIGYVAGYAAGNAAGDATWSARGDTAWTVEENAK